MDDLESRVTAVEQRCRGDGRRLDKLEQEQAVIHSLATSLQVMAAEQKHQTEALRSMREDVSRLDGKVDALEMKPARRWDGLVTNWSGVWPAACSPGCWPGPVSEKI